jgi:hypothetical protein
MTMLPTERIAYSSIATRPPLKLPNGARMAVWVIVNVEEWDAKQTMPRTGLFGAFFGRQAALRGTFRRRAFAAGLTPRCSGTSSANARALSHANDNDQAKRLSFNLRSADN